MRTPVDTQQINGDDTLADELVPMGIATRMMNVKVYRRDGSPSRLTGIAHALAALAPVYTYSVDGSEIRQLTDQELISGFFRKDGAELYFMDGRPPIINIAVTNEAIELVAETLTASANGEERLPPSSPQLNR